MTKNSKLFFTAAEKMINLHIFAQKIAKIHIVSEHHHTKSYLMSGCKNIENMKLFTPIAPKKTPKAFCTFASSVDLKTKLCN